MNDSAEGIVEKANTYTGVVTSATHYTLKGEVLTRLLFWNQKSQDEFLNRSNYKPDCVYALKNVIVRLFEAGKSSPLAETRTNASGLFEFKKLLEEKKEYKLIAVLKIKDNNLEEHVTIEKIKDIGFPPIDGTKLIHLKQSNYCPPSASTNDRPVLDDKDEEITPSAKTSSSGEKTLEFTKNSALLFGSFMLNVPYINQLVNSIYIEEVKVRISGEKTCFPTSMAMMMDYYGKKPNTTQDMAEKVYNTWRDEGFPNQSKEKKKDGSSPYDYVFNPTSIARIWQVWVWVNRVVRKTVGLKTTDIWKDNGREGELPEPNNWCAYRAAGNLLRSSDSYLRRNIGRGYPTVAGTNAPGGSHVMIIRGLLLGQKDGKIRKIIFNDPYGNLEFNTRPVNKDPPTKKYWNEHCSTHYRTNDVPAGKNKPIPSSANGRAVYYDSNTWGHGPYDKKKKIWARPQQLRVGNYITLRFGFSRDDVRDKKLVHGSS